jgi:hypothetical protein
MPLLMLIYIYIYIYTRCFGKKIELLNFDLGDLCYPKKLVLY